MVASVSTDSDSTDEEEVESLVEEETVNRVGLNSSCDRVAPFSAPPVYHRRHDESVCRLPCNHFFCFSCMLKWATYSSTCPNCRCVLENLVEKYKNNDPPQPLWWEGCSELKQEEEENALQGGIEKIQQAEKSSSWEANEEIRPLFSVSSTETPEPLEAAPASADANPEIRTEEVLGNEGSRTSWVPLENETDSSILHPLVQPTPPALPNTTPYSHPFFMSTGTTTYSNATVLSSETDFSPSTSPAFPSYPPQDSRKANTFPSTMEPNSSLALVHSTSIEGTSGPREGGLPSLVRDTHESHLLFCSPNESHSPVMAEASEEKKMPQLLAPTTVLSSSGGFAGRRSMIDSDAEQLTGLKVLNEPEVLLAETGKESAVREVDHELSLSQPVASTLSSNQFASDFSTDMDVEAYGSGVKTVKRIRNSRRETPHAQLLSGSGSLHSSHVSLPQESVSGVAPNSSDLGSSLLSYRRARVPFLTNREVIAGHPPSDLSIFPRIRLGSERPGPNRLRVVYPVSPSTSSSQDVLEKRGQ